MGIGAPQYVCLEGTAPPHTAFATLKSLPAICSGSIGNYCALEKECHLHEQVPAHSSSLGGVLHYSSGPRDAFSP